MATEIVDCCSNIALQYCTCAQFLVSLAWRFPLVLFLFYRPAMRRRGADAACSGRNAFLSSVV